MGEGTPDTDGFRRFSFSVMGGGSGGGGGGGAIGATCALITGVR